MEGYLRFYPVNNPGGSKRMDQLLAEHNFHSSGSDSSEGPKANMVCQYNGCQKKCHTYSTAHNFWAA